MKLKKYCPDFLFPILQKTASLNDILLFDFFKLITRMDRKKIVMLLVSRKTLCGNPLFIYRKLTSKDFYIRVILENDGTTKAQLLKAVAQSRFIIIDDYTKLLYPLKMRKNARLIQVWHSTGAFKRMGFARMGHEGSTVRTSLTHRNYTDVIVSSEGVVKDFAEAFGVKESAIHPIGVPRTDVFFDKKYADKTRHILMEKFPVLKTKKLILFAPTFRGNTRSDAYYPSEYLDIKRLYQEFGNDYILGIKLHPFIENKIEIDRQYRDFVIDFSDSREINDLLFITDILVTDYSSVIFEYALLKKKIVFYAPDLESYIKDRDFFYDYSRYIYGSLAKSPDELIDAIKNARVDKDKLNGFYKKFLSACDGKSTDRFIDFLAKEN